eukprot:CAMPEP_0181171838 /NCGR_PEP_ID=MMETSP1096-20121128/2126_1 /TAXON_ID=156174 ORGANISM="Chrysochromulina ericina, Strain CCMP281" /NCGR_SAMPLE_ID=MMETSP1096 /ASSEMBLY_ACC=CAM_ASM_000453 /LENGTH=41 /DNA_ID= /DNA_START= /DNA_END= /DNA_ORIENTATION=
MAMLLRSQSLVSDVSAAELTRSPEPQLAGDMLARPPPPTAP